MVSPQILFTYTLHHAKLQALLIIIIFIFMK